MGKAAVSLRREQIECQHGHDGRRFTIDGYYDGTQLIKVTYSGAGQARYYGPEDSIDGPGQARIPKGKSDYLYVACTKPIALAEAEIDSNGFFHGVYRQFSEEGKEICVGRFEQGQMTGVWKKFDADGHVKAEFQFEADQPMEGTVYDKRWAGKSRKYKGFESHDVVWDLFKFHPIVDPTNARKIKLEVA